MKSSIFFFIKLLVIGLVLSQTTTADTGYSFIGFAIDEPIYLSLCGIVLLYLGLYKPKAGAKDLG